MHQIESPILKEGLRLHALGFAILWVIPKTKQPVGRAWTTGPRKERDALIASFHAAVAQYGPDLNLGVRLGEPSCINGAYLCVIDCDLKDPGHLSEFEFAIQRNVTGFEAMPRVLSGRKNGSRHFYVLTKEPKRKGILAKSETVIKAKEGKKHAVHAWVIETLGTGNFVVLPPSIHPDSGLSYDWEKPIVSVGSIPLMHPELEAAIQFSNEALSGDSKSSFNFVDVDLEGDDKLGPDDVALIVRGELSVDRSAEVFTMALKMSRFGYTDDQIVSVFTDPKNFLAHAALDRRKSRTSAAQWVYDHCLKKAKSELSAARAFETDYIDAPTLTPEAAAAQAEAIKPDWRSKIDRAMGGADIGRPRNKPQNIKLFLLNGVSENTNPFTWDTFADEIRTAFDTPFGKKGEKFSDQMIIEIKDWLSESFRLHASNDLIFEGAIKLARQNATHPVREYLNALEWDRVPRLDKWLKTYLNAQGDDKYLAEVGTKILIAMVKRVFEPGCKFDQMLVLEGDQGCGKSTAVSILGGKWSCDTFLDPSNKDTVLYMQGAWAVEVPELSGMNRADQNHLKAFITKGFDRIRPPYGKLQKDIDRQCVFIGTTNDSNYLRDESGNRRYWPVKVGQLDTNALRLARDQLFAEAKVYYDIGEEIYISDATINAIANAEQKKRLATNDFEEALIEWVYAKVKGLAKDTIDHRALKTQELTADSDSPLFTFARGNQNQYFVAAALKRLGYCSHVVKRNGHPVKLWVLSAEKEAEILSSLDKNS